MKQVAIVTGAAQGLGQVIARHLLDAGFHIALTDANEKGVNEAAEQLDPSGTRVLGMQLNVLRKEDFQQALQRVEARFGQVTVMINNAAMTPTTPVMEISEEEFDQVIAVNLRGTFFGCQVLGAYFAEQGYGRIINMASLAGQNGGTASGAHYASSKGAIVTLTKIFARQLADSNVTVNAIAPGPMDLPSVRAAVPAEKLDKIINEMIPVKSLGDADFVANTVVHLARQDAGFVTGATWDISGGIYMR